MGDSTTTQQPWAKEQSVDARLELWWSKLMPHQRAWVLSDFDADLPEWMAQSLLRWGVPLSIDPGLAPGSVAGEFLVPAECTAFVQRKRVEVVPPKRFWQRRARP